MASLNGLGHAVQGSRQKQDKRQKSQDKSEIKEKGKSQEDKAPHLGGWGVKRQKFKATDWKTGLVDIFIIKWVNFLYIFQTNPHLMKIWDL